MKYKTGEFVWLITSHSKIAKCKIGGVDFKRKKYLAVPMSIHLASQYARRGEIFRDKLKAERKLLTRLEKQADRCEERIQRIEDARMFGL